MVSKRSSKGVSRECQDVSRKFQGCLKKFSMVFQGFFLKEGMLFRETFKVDSRQFQVIFTSILRKFQRCSKNVSIVFQGNIKKKNQGCSKNSLRKFHLAILMLHGLLIAATQEERRLVFILKQVGLSRVTLEFQV